MIVSIRNEDRTYGGSHLYIDLVPKTSWNANLRAALPRHVWRTLGALVRSRGDGCCELCGTRPPTLDVHERWQYLTIEGEHVQRLIRLLCLCKNCHMATHMGFAHVRGQGEKALAHLARVNRWTLDRARQHENEAYLRWEERSRITWRLDLSMILAHGDQDATRAGTRERALA